MEDREIESNTKQINRKRNKHYKGTNNRTKNKTLVCLKSSFCQLNSNSVKFLFSRREKVKTKSLRMEIENVSKSKLESSESRNDNNRDRVKDESDEIVSLEVALELLKIEKSNRIRLESQVIFLTDRLQVSDIKKKKN